MPHFQQFAQQIRRMLPQIRSKMHTRYTQVPRPPGSVRVPPLNKDGTLVLHQYIKAEKHRLSSFHSNIHRLRSKWTDFKWAVCFRRCETKPLESPSAGSCKHSHMLTVAAYLRLSEALLKIFSPASKYTKCPRQIFRFAAEKRHKQLLLQQTTRFSAQSNACVH